MAKAIIILAVIATAYGAVLKNEGIPLQRVARSPCSTCGPPPPPILHTQNWSGLARSSDGLQNTVFSGAAAAAADQGPTAVGEAFSLASSSAGAGLGGSANSGLDATGSSGNGGSSGSNGAGAHYGGYSGVKGGYTAGEYGGGHKVSGGGFKESHHSYHSEGSKDFGAQGGFEQDGQTAASSASSSAAQGGSFGGNNKDVAFGGSGREFSGSLTNRGDADVGETQNQGKGSFSGSNEFQQSNHQNGPDRGFNSASSSGPSSSFGGNREHAGGNHFEHRFSSENEKEVSSIERNERGHGKGHFGPGLSSGQEIQQSHFDGAAGQGNFAGLNDQRRVDEFSNSRVASQGQFQSGFSSGGERERIEEQGRFRPHGSYKHGRGFKATESQSSSSAQGGLGSGQYQQSENLGQSQAAVSDRRIGQGGFGTSSSGQQGFVSGSGSADAQSALSGALNLASQGLQSSSQAGCSTCGKSSYALSNAKSHSGSAVAVSIGG